jgi:hypothetical protein
MDRAYIDFECLDRLANKRINVVIHSKTNMKFGIQNSGQTDPSSGVLSDQANTNMAEQKTEISRMFALSKVLDIFD